MTIIETILIILAAFWTTSAIVYSDGPGILFVKLRHKYEFLECFICVAFWVSLAITLLAYFVPVAIYPLAIAGGALLLDKVKNNLDKSFR